MAAALERARSALDAGDDESALEALLEAWRESRSTRVAALIDRVSERLGGGAVEGKSVKARTEAWLALAPNASPRTVGQLLATPWPGKWADAVPVLTALRALPHDPRIAMHLARTVQDTPWDTYKSHAFYNPLLNHLAALRDARTIAILEADLERVKSSYWERGTKPNVAAALKTLRAAASTTEPDERTLAALEELFASETASEASQARSEDELLAAVYAAADDDGPRIVYADWLGERGLPRGEFIALQLATGGSAAEQEKRRKRARTLLNKYASGWAGPLDPFLQPKGRAFERGFIARGSLLLEGGKIGRGIDTPAWATLRTLVVGWDAQYSGHALEVLALPCLQHLTRLIGLYSDLVMQLPLRPALEELDIQIDSSKDCERDIAKGTSFPNLRRLGIEGPLDRIEQILDGPLGRRLEVVTRYGYEHPIGPLVRLVEKLGLSRVHEVRTVHYMQGNEDSWRFAMTRDANGQFTIFYGVLHGAERGTGGARYLVQALQTLEPHELTSFTIDRGEPSSYDAREIQDIEAELARFPKVTHVSVPWERLTKPKPIAEALLPVYADLWRHDDYDAATYEKLWREVAKPPLSLTFDSYDVNNGAHQSLDEDGLATLQKALAKKRTWGLHAYRKDELARLALSYSSIVILGLLARDATTITHYLDWLAHLVDAVGFERGSVYFVRHEEKDGSLGWRAQQHLRRLHSIDRALAWIWILEAEVDARIPFVELEKLPERFDGIRAIRTKRALMLVLGATPADIPTDEQRDALDVAIFEILWNTFEKKHGFRPHDRVAKAFAPILSKYGFERRELDPVTTARGHVVFAAPSEKETRWIYFEPSIAPEDLVLSFHARHSRARPDADLRLHDQIERQRDFGSNEYRAASAEQMETRVNAAVAGLEDALSWFEKE